MAQKYYNSQDAAKALGISVDEVRQMLERRELHGYRDGSDWKFKTEDIDLLVKERGQPRAATPGADDGGDVLLSEVELGHSDPGTSGTVIAMNWGERGTTDSDIQLAGSDLTLAADSKGPAAAKKSGKSDDLKLSSDDALSLKDSSVALAAVMGKPRAKSGPGASDIDLGGAKSDDNLVLGGSKPGSDVTLSSSDSGISLVDPSDSGLSLEEPVLAGAGEESLELGEDDMLSAGEGSDAMAAVPVKTDDEFLLTPLEEAADSQESSESGSQVIALDSETDSATMIGLSSGVGGTMAAMLDEDVSAPRVAPPGMAGPVLGAQPAVLMEGAALMQPEAALFEAPYTGLQIAGLATCAVLLMLCGMMAFDLMRTMWGWSEPYSVNSSLMDGLGGLFGFN
jgi:excisionase family DNA binding protein